MSVSICLAQDPAADEILGKDPLALLIGMLLDQQQPMERAFAGPAKIAERLGDPARLDVGRIAAMEPTEFAEIVARSPAVHRFPGSMAGRIQQLASAVLADYDGDAAKIWSGAESGAELKRRLLALPGFGEQKAKIFIALLGKQVGVTPDGWQEAAGDYGQAGYRSVADVVDADSLVKVREFKQMQKKAAKK